MDVQNKKFGNFISISRLAGKCAAQKFKKNILIMVILKGLAQAKIIKKSVILFRVLNMTISCKPISCKHVHRLELQIFIIFVLRIHQLD